MESNEVPLSNREVLKVLEERQKNNDSSIHPRTLEMIEYLKKVEVGPYTYPLEILRNLKEISSDLRSDLTTLTLVSNLSDLSLLSNSDKAIINSHFK